MSAKTGSEYTAVDKERNVRLRQEECTPDFFASLKSICPPKTPASLLNSDINLLATDFFFQILAHPVFKM